MSDMKFTKAFEVWWACQDKLHLEPWQSYLVKRMCFRAWQHGRRKMRGKPYTYKETTKRGVK
jgi:hypothetical protein